MPQHRCCPPQVWEAAALRATPLLLRDAPVDENILELPPAPEGEEIMFDYAATGLTLRRHPLALLRPLLTSRKLMAASDLQEIENGEFVSYGGIVTLRQQPENLRVAGGRDRHGADHCVEEYQGSPAR